MFSNVIFEVEVLYVAVMSGYALLAGRFRNRVRDRRAVVLQNRMFGAIFVGAGCLLAGASRH